jgi:hypothetical protein
MTFAKWTVQNCRVDTLVPFSKEGLCRGGERGEKRGATKRSKSRPSRIDERSDAKLSSSKQGEDDSSIVAVPNMNTTTRLQHATLAVEA